MITFEATSKSLVTIQRYSKVRQKHLPRWNSKIYDVHLFKAAILIATWTMDLINDMSAEDAAVRLEVGMKNACDATMRRTRDHYRNSTYWWTPELALQRRKCLGASRRISRLSKAASNSFVEFGRGYKRLQ